MWENVNIPSPQPLLASPSKELPASAGPLESQRLLLASNPLVVGAPSYGALPGRMRCGPYGGEERNLGEISLGQRED